MIIKYLELNNFRNLNIVFKPILGANLILGQNGVGKTNLLDSIYHLSFAKSFKPYTLKNNVNFDNPDFAYIKSIININDLDKELKIVFTKENNDYEKRKLFVNTKATTKSKFITNLSLILFAPHNTNLLTSSPDIRRLELDDFITTIDFKYSIIINEYRELIKTRNSLLRSLREGFGNKDELDYWDKKLAELGGKIIKYRKEIINNIKPLINIKSNNIFDNNLRDLNIEYITKFNSNNPILELESKIKDNRDKEILIGQTLYGPHKDDFAIYSDNKDLKYYGSRGQQRITTLLLKLSMWEYIYNIKKEKPIILLDDAMAELDKENRLKLEKIILGLKAQTFITTTHKNDYSKQTINNMNILNLQ